MKRLLVLSGEGKSEPIAEGPVDGLGSVERTNEENSRATELMPILVGLAILVVLLAVLWTIRASTRKAITSVSDVSPLVDAMEMESIIEFELQRARRLDYPVSLIVLRIAKDQPAHPPPAKVIALFGDTARGTPATSEEEAALSIARRSRAELARLRSTDNVLFDQEQQRFVMALVGTSKQHAERIAARIGVSIEENLRCPSHFGCAAFPEDGLFADDLLKHAAAVQPEEPIPVMNATG